MPIFHFLGPSFIIALWAKCWSPQTLPTTSIKHNGYFLISSSLESSHVRGFKQIFWHATTSVIATRQIVPCQNQQATNTFLSGEGSFYHHFCHNLTLGQSRVRHSPEINPWWHFNKNDFEHFQFSCLRMSKGQTITRELQIYKDINGRRISYVSAEMDWQTNIYQNVCLSLESSRHTCRQWVDGSFLPIDLLHLGS